MVWILSWAADFPQKVYTLFSPLATQLNNILNRPELFDGYWISYILLISFLFAIFYITDLTENLKKITGVQVSGLSFSIKTPNYFDANIEQIIHLFKKSKIEYVVFEDLDRFKNIEILEQLKYLNTIINNMLTEEKDGKQRTVHFIYTLDDAVYLKLDEENSNYMTEISVVKDFRNKFFDISFSVMPHISPLNSLATINKYLKKIGVTSTEYSAIKSLSTLINDNRLAINIVNDFKVYSAQLSNSSWFNLSEQQANILAMIVAYKNINPSDFNEFMVGSSNSDYHRIRENFEGFVDNFSAEKANSALRELTNSPDSIHLPENNVDHKINRNLYRPFGENIEIVLKMRSLNEFIKKVDKIEYIISELKDFNIINDKGFNSLNSYILSTQEILSKNPALKLIMLSDNYFKPEYSLYCLSNSKADQKYETLAYLFGNLSTVDKLIYNLPPQSLEEVLSHESVSDNLSLIYNKYILEYLADWETRYFYISEGNKFYKKLKADIAELSGKLGKIFNQSSDIIPLEWNEYENRWVNTENYEKLSSEIISNIQNSDFGSMINEIFNYLDTEEILALMKSVGKLGDKLSIVKDIRFILSCFVYAHQIDLDSPDNHSLVRYPEHALALLLISLNYAEHLSSNESRFSDFISQKHGDMSFFDQDYFDDLIGKFELHSISLPKLDEAEILLSNSTFLSDLISAGKILKIYQ